MKTYLRIWLTIPVFWFAPSEKAFTQDQVQTQRRATTPFAWTNLLSIGFNPKLKLPGDNPAFALRNNPKKYFDDAFIFFLQNVI